jgi:hypothetical protein
MPVHMRSEGRFIVMLSRDGEPENARTAEDGRKALKAALLLLAELDDLRHGDKLECFES